MIVRRMVVGCIDEFFKFRIRNRRSIDVETVNVHAVPMKAPRRIFPGILHIDSGIIAALTSIPLTLKS